MQEGGANLSAWEVEEKKLMVEGKGHTCGLVYSTSNLRGGTPV